MAEFWGFLKDSREILSRFSEILWDSLERTETGFEYSKLNAKAADNEAD